MGSILKYLIWRLRLNMAVTFLQQYELFKVTRWVKLRDLYFDIIYVPFEYKFIKVLNQS